LFAAHAEANLISFAARVGIPTKGCTVYVTHAPCSNCAKTLIQAGVEVLVIGDGTTSMPPEEFHAASVMFREAGVHTSGMPPGDKK
jgi:dCMP deaminase